MKKLWYFPCVILLFGILLNCERDPAKQEYISGINLVKTTPGGCNIGDKSTLNDRKDTVIISTGNDTLNIFAGISYICCAPFTSSLTCRNDSILITATDTCTSSLNCYCRCMCYYSWDFKLVDFGDKEYYYKFTLFSRFAGDEVNAQPLLIEEGTITMSEIR